MSDHPDIASAKALGRSLLKRLVADANGNFRFEGPVTSDERQALMVLLEDSDRRSESKQTPATPVHPHDHGAVSFRFGTPSELTEECLIEMKCLQSKANAPHHVAIDFGTAYSKASFWRYEEDDPLSLDLGIQVGDQSSLLLPSTLYITDGFVYFGRQAVEISRREDSAERRRFDSPKQELSILEGADLDGLADKAVDPSRTLTRRELLVLFLGYLNFATTQGLISAKVDPYSPRMFAVPMWKDKQLGSTVKLLKRLMVDGQILADSLPSSVWRAGIKVEDARRVLREIETSLADADRDAAAFVKRHVLEATASAAAIEDHMSNSRPNVLIVDVGAGTTDLGFYKFVLPNIGQARIYPYRNGGSALKIAGDRLDQLLINFIRKQGGLDEHSADGLRSMYVIRRDIRDLKQQLFATGSLSIEGVCDATITSGSFLACAEVSAFKERFKSEVAKLIDLVGVENVKSEGKVFVVLTGGSASVPVFRDVFKENFEIGGTILKFETLNVVPKWLLDLDSATQELFPQLAVAAGACSPALPDEMSFVSDTSAAPRRTIAPNYKS